MMSSSSRGEGITLPKGAEGQQNPIKQGALGESIRELRKARARTLSDVAAHAGISPSLLSQVERGQTSPSLESLTSIANALGTSPIRLLAGSTPSVHLVRADSGKRLPSSDSALEAQLLSPSSIGTFEITLWNLSAGRQIMAQPWAHRWGHEAIFVVSGNLNLEVGEELLELGPGDCVTFDARIPHRTTAMGGPTTAISILSPPTH